MNFLKDFLEKSMFQQIINFKKDCSDYQIIETMNNIINYSPEIFQLLINTYEITKKEGIIEYLIEKYMEGQDKNDILKEFFIKISKSFQINKHIYDFIYKKIGKLIQINLTEEQNNITQNENNIQFFERGIDLLMIFYHKYSDTKYLIKDNFFFLNNHKIKTKIIDETNNLNIHIEMNLFFNKNPINNESTIIKISFSNNEILEINSIKKNIEIFFNDKMIDDNNNIQLSENKWNNFLIKIINEKIYININYKEPIIISKNNINNENKNNLINNNENIIKDKKPKFFIKLSFYKKFCGFVCPIIISNSDFSTSENLMKNKIERINEKNKNDNYKKIFKYCDNLIIQLKNEDFKIETISKKKDQKEIIL